MNDSARHTEVPPTGFVHIADALPLAIDILRSAMISAGGYADLLGDPTGCPVRGCGADVAAEPIGDGAVELVCANGHAGAAICRAVAAELDVAIDAVDQELEARGLLVDGEVVA